MQCNVEQKRLPQIIPRFRNKHCDTSIVVLGIRDELLTRRDSSEALVMHHRLRLVRETCNSQTHVQTLLENVYLIN